VVFNTSHPYLISKIMAALGEFNDSHLEELKRITQDGPAVFWNLGYDSFCIHIAFLLICPHVPCVVPSNRAREVPLSCRAVLHNQVLDVAWRCPCAHTKAPVLDCVFKLCESVKAWYDLNEKNLAIIHCPPNYPSTGILVACLLKYIGAFDKAEQAYDFYCNRRCVHFVYLRLCR
jgi:hypothetical protein